MTRERQFLSELIGLLDYRDLISVIKTGAFQMAGRKQTCRTSAYDTDFYLFTLHFMSPLRSDFVLSARSCDPVAEILV